MICIQVVDVDLLWQNKPCLLAQALRVCTSVPLWGWLSVIWHHSGCVQGCRTVRILCPASCRNSQLEGISTSPADCFLGWRCKTLLSTTATLMQLKFPTNEDTCAIQGQMANQQYRYNHQSHHLRIWQNLFRVTGANLEAIGGILSSSDSESQELIIIGGHRLVNMTQSHWSRF